MSCKEYEGSVRPFLWLHIRKAGGTSVKRLIRPYYPSSEWRYGTPFIALDRAQWNNNLNNHLVSLGHYDYRRMLFAKNFMYDEGEFANMYKFAVVRNPYVRAVSAWQYLTKDWRFTKPRQMMARKSFAYFLQMLPEIWEKRWDRHVSTHTAPMWGDITDEDGNLLLDDVYRLESLDDNMETLCQKIGLSSTPLAHENKGRTNSYSRHLTRRTIALIEDLYAEDIENLGYTLPNIRA